MVLLLLTEGLARSQISIFESFPGKKKTNKTQNKAKPKPLAVEIQMFSVYSHLTSIKICEMEKEIRFLMMQ